MNRVLPALLCLLLGVSGAYAQCVPVPVGDSSFQEGTLSIENLPLMGNWARDDGCQTSAANPFHEDSVAKSNGGGALQRVPVRAGETYYLSFYILNGASDYSPSIRIDTSRRDIQVPTDDWTLVSESFVAQTDSVLIWFYSMGASFDLFRITCSPVTEAYEPALVPEPLSLEYDHGAGSWRLQTRKAGKLQISDLSGRLLLSRAYPAGEHDLPSLSQSGVYIVRFESDLDVAVYRIWVPEPN